MRSKKAIYNVLTNLILQVIVVIYGFIIPKIIISNFGSNVNGLVSSITQFLGYITLLESGFGPVVKSILYKPIANKDKCEILNILKTTEKFFRKISYIFIVYIALLCVIYPLLVNNEFSFLFTISLIIIISVSTFAEYYFGMTYRLYLQAEQENYIISLIQIITYVLSVIVIVLLVKFNANIQLIKLLSGLIFMLRPICLNYYVKRKFNIDFRKADDNYKIKNKWDGLAQHIAFVIHSNTDISILTIFSNMSEVSVYSIYSLVVTGIKTICLSFLSGIDSFFGDMIAKGEKNNLNNKFNIYEVLYNTLNTIIFTCAMILIVPFVTVYTKGITDTNYIRYTFGYLIVISEYIWAIRQPYNELVKATGHFKETRIGAWVECITNIVISIILVFKFGIIGVAIGTIVAMLIRTIEFVYHTNKYILERSIWLSIKKIILVVIETIIVVLISKYIPYLSNINYINWIVNAIMVFVVASVLVCVVNFIFYKKEFKEFIMLIKKIYKWRKKQ